VTENLAFGLEPAGAWRRIDWRDRRRRAEALLARWAPGSIPMPPRRPAHGEQQEVEIARPRRERAHPSDGRADGRARRAEPSAFSS